jgi:hypothetical protein
MSVLFDDRVNFLYATVSDNARCRVRLSRTFIFATSTLPHSLTIITESKQRMTMMIPT